MFLYNKTEDVEVTKDKIRQHRQVTLVPSPSQAGGFRPYCHHYMFFWTSHKSSYFSYRPKFDAAMRAAPVEIHILAWFNELKRTLEKMPDSGDYMVGAARRKDVYKWYQSDQQEWPNLYLPCSPPYFLKVWRQKVPEVKLRKWLRFTKCSVCEHWRKVRWDFKNSPEARNEAMLELEAHYVMVKHERAYALEKVIVLVGNVEGGKHA